MSDGDFSSLEAIGAAARAASQILAMSTAERRNEALRQAARFLRLDRTAILDANRYDLAESGEGGALRDRLTLTEARIDAMAKGLEEIAALPDPLGRRFDGRTRPNGLMMERISVPLGVIGIIYESRPNVTADAASIAIKAGNAAILRGGSESKHSSSAILACLKKGLAAAGLPEESIAALPSYDRALVGEMLRLDRYIDLIVPRGGKGLIARVQAESRIPVLAHLEGNNHTYIHVSADPAMAVPVVCNAKMRRPGVCGATEKLLVDRAIAPMVLPQLIAELSSLGCALRGDEEAQRWDRRIGPADETDWGREYLDAILAIRIVANLEDAIRHIGTYGSRHTEAIIAGDADAIARFEREIDAAIIISNASTQFADGGEFGMGAEIGIATGKLHARGPVGPMELTSYKWLVHGRGQTRR
ncbi:MAG TPA: glutamate-5-semialdehyde dehydrogenase [Dongiaceae bacterium]|jgi:glutamate-5-semialdehyde dehydrogenase|nr:glutamate-5-semialdehyde dehydrogenase [Dongiaceae bacterium]